VKVSGAIPEGLVLRDTVCDGMLLIRRKQYALRLVGYEVFFHE